MSIRCRLVCDGECGVIFLLPSRGGGMADATDLKSVVRKDVRVRLPPSAPFQISRFKKLVFVSRIVHVNGIRLLRIRITLR